MTQLFGITHLVPMRLLWFWRRVFCVRGWHAWDEVIHAPEFDTGARVRSLSCDACGLRVQLSYIDPRYMSVTHREALP